VAMDARAIRFPSFFERPPWLTGDLQTLRNIIRRPIHDLAPWPERRLELPTTDGDRLIAHLHHPPDRPRAMAMLIHGLSGCADSVYVRATARHLLDNGYGVIRLNLRGAGPSAASCRSQYHAGRSEDIRAAIAGVRASLDGVPLLAIGYSLGGNVLLKYLGEEGGSAPLAAAVAVSAPLDLAAASQRLLARRNRFYQEYLVTRMKADALAVVDEENARTVREVHTVFDFDDRFVAPRHGFTDAADYYARSSARNYLDGVRVPTLVIHGLNDPWIPPEAYRAVPWSRLRFLTPLLARGGHVGFHGIDSRVPWHDRCAALFAGHIVKQ